MVSNQLVGSVQGMGIDKWFKQHHHHSHTHTTQTEQLSSTRCHTGEPALWGMNGDDNSHRCTTPLLVVDAKKMW